jgi:hypothetical protein
MHPSEKILEVAAGRVLRRRPVRALASAVLEHAEIHDLVLALKRDPAEEHDNLPAEPATEKVNSDDETEEC